MIKKFKDLVSKLKINLFDKKQIKLEKDLLNKQVSFNLWSDLALLRKDAQFALKKFDKKMKKNKTNFDKRTPHIRDGFMEYSKNYSSILPSPSILESYEEISPGFVENLLKIIKEEQNNRHKLEERKIKGNHAAAKFKQVMHFFSVIMLIYTTFIISSENITLSVIICVMGFAALMTFSGTPFLKVLSGKFKTHINEEKEIKNYKEKPYQKRNRRRIQ